MTNSKGSSKRKASLSALSGSVGMVDLSLISQTGANVVPMSGNYVRSGNGIANNNQCEELARSGNGIAYADQIDDIARSGNGIAYADQIDDIARSGNGIAYVDIPVGTLQIV